jgi:hypothetical protein
VPGWHGDSITSTHTFTAQGYATERGSEEHLTNTLMYEFAFEGYGYRGKYFS